MKLLAKLWQNFKIQPDIWFFYGFLLTFTLSVRKVIYFFSIEGSFNEYASICLYLSDIFLFLTILTWAISILESKSLFLSRKTLAIPLFLALWAFLSISWSENHWLAIFRSIKVLEFYLLFLYTSQKLFHACPVGQKCSTWNISGQFRGGTFLRNSFLIISIMGLFQSIIGIIQIFLQHSIGLFWLKESLISPEIPGVAKIILNGERYIRAYGLFPHPNILGGFLVFSIIITIYLLKVPRLPAGKMFHVEHFWEGETFISTFLKNSLGIQIIGLILTFSKSAILGLIIALAYLAYRKMFHPVKFLRNHGAGAKHLKIKLLAILVFLALIAVIAKPDFYSLFQKSLEERLLGYKIVFNNAEMFHACPVGQKCSTWNISEHFRGGTFITNPIAGIGQGQFVLEMRKYIPQKLEAWQFQPVHNVFLLILSELGLVELGLFIWFLWKLLRSSTTSSAPTFTKVGTPSPYKGEGLSAPSPLQGEGWGEVGEVGKAILLAFIFIMLFDHYLWDIQQGQILLWLTFGLIAGDSKS